ncbi:hypothetical protein M0805_003336 [Coniferiporia weirii]|nr:hypothetical protein M0805_003336 [Coniferiporia weirii]
MDRDNFKRLNDLIKDNEIFVSTDAKQQRPSWYQLAVFLLRYGGDSASNTAEEEAISEGTVHLYCSRVVHAFRQIRSQYLSWPDSQRRLSLKTEMALHGFPGCIGVVGGSLIPLESKPSVDGELYWCWLYDYYAAVCDQDSRFEAFEMGWPGSVQNAQVFRESAIWLKKSKHFKDDEYILADRGYPLTKSTILPFSISQLTDNPAEEHRRRRFNVSHSRLRKKIEHAVGMLKGRFPALRSMPSSGNINNVYCAIEALMVVHNILIDFHDDPTEIDDYNGSNDEDVVRPHRGFAQEDSIIDPNLFQAGLTRRDSLLEITNQNNG